MRDSIALDSPRTEGSVLSLDELATLSARHRELGRIVVLCHGVFDLVHPGHLRHFAAARREGDVLLVTVTPDVYVNKGPGRPFFSEALRAEMVAALRPVDAVAVNRWPTAIPTIELVRPLVYAKGSEYSDAASDLTGMISEEAAAVRAVGGRVHFTEDITFSSTVLLNQAYDVVPAAGRRFLSSVRAEMSAEKLIAVLRGLSRTRVLIGRGLTGTLKEQLSLFADLVPDESSHRPDVVVVSRSDGNSALSWLDAGDRAAAAVAMVGPDTMSYTEPLGRGLSAAFEPNGAVLISHANESPVRVPPFARDSARRDAQPAFAMMALCAHAGLQPSVVGLVGAALLSTPSGDRGIVDPVSLYKAITALLK